MDAVLKTKKATYHLWTFFISKMISTFGAQIYAFGMSFYILSLTGSATNFALNLIFSVLPRTIIGPFAGYLSDKFSKKKIVIIAQLASALAVSALLLYSMVDGLSIPAIYVTTAILSVTSSFTGIAFSASIANLVDPPRLQKAMSYNQMSVSMASIAGPAIGGLLFGTVSITTFFVIQIVSYVIAVVLESTMNFHLFSTKNVEKVSEVKESMVQNMRGGISYLKKNKLLTTVMGVGLTVNFLFGAFMVGFSFVLVDQLKLDSRDFGIAEGALSFGVILGSIYLSMRKELKQPLAVGKYGIMLIGIFVAAVSVPLFITFNYLGVVLFFVILMLANGITLAFVNTPLGVLMQKMIEEEFRGRVFGIMETMAQALIPAGMLLFGFMYDIFPSQWVLIGSGIALIITVGILLRSTVLEKVEKNQEEMTKDVESQTMTA
ncbi:MFS transporter [Paenisporosarcina cavernae]|uniref:MFS transporter n=1 Tax=Paenisporosarcina cavernae TaxID=2320858 RepID=A0A385YXQ2_9BACL|nr:MFS transporter [Paenisporosarcina cavernae]AYC30378.1 MFS transporter [Paenisporosarcina cavernae]